MVGLAAAAKPADSKPKTTNVTNAAFTITDVGNTSNIVTFVDGFSLDDMTASILIAGVGDFTFITATRTFVNNVVGEVGFSRSTTTGSDLYDGPVNAAFNTWQLNTALGPFSGSATLLQWGSPYPPVLTSGGTLFFANGSTMATFQAILGALGLYWRQGCLE